MLGAGAGLGEEDHADAVLGPGEGVAGYAGGVPDASVEVREVDLVAGLQGGEPVVGDGLRLLAEADEGGEESGGVGLHRVLGAGVVDEELRVPLLALDVQDLSVLEPAGALGPLEVALGEEEGRLLDPGALAAAGLLADGPALRPARVVRRGQPVGGVGDAEDRAARRLALVELLVLDLDDLELVGVEQEPGGGEVEDGVEQGLPVLALAGLQDDVPGRRLLADDHAGAGVVPALGGGGLEHAPGAEPGDDQRGDDHPGEDRAQRAWRPSSVPEGEGWRNAATVRFFAKVYALSSSRRDAMSPHSRQARSSRGAAGGWHPGPGRRTGPLLCLLSRGVRGAGRVIRPPKPWRARVIGTD